MQCLGDKEVTEGYQKEITGFFFRKQLIDGEDIVVLIAK